MPSGSSGGSIYNEVRNARYLKFTPATPGTNIAGQTSFNANNPTFVIEQDMSALTDNTQKRRAVLRSLRLGQVGTVAGGPITIAIVLDDILRRAGAKGTQIATPTSPAMDTAIPTLLGATPLSLWYESATGLAVNAGANARAVFIDTVPAALGTSYKLPDGLRDEIQLGYKGAIVIYTWAAVTAPTWTFEFGLNIDQNQ